MPSTHLKNIPTTETTKKTGKSVSEKIVSLVSSIQNECWNRPEFHSLFRNEIKDHPIPFFGDLENAKVVTIGVNPSSTEFESCRGWDSKRMPDAELSARLMNYFTLTYPQPHSWFGAIEEALNIIGCSYRNNAVHLDISPRATRSMRTFLFSSQKRNMFLAILKNDVKWLPKTFSLIKKPKLVICVGKVVDEKNCRGIGTGDFLSRHIPEFWSSSLKGRRWPNTPCSKAELAFKVYKNRKSLLEFLSLKQNQ